MEPPISKRNNPFIVAFLVNTLLFLLLEQRRPPLYAREAALEHLLTFLTHLVYYASIIQLLSSSYCNLDSPVTASCYLGLITLEYTEYSLLLLYCLVNVSLCPCAPYLFVSIRKRRFCTSYMSYVPSTLKSVANYVLSKVLVGEGARLISK
jgi:hypothetical protein